MEGYMFLIVTLGIKKSYTYQKLFYENPKEQFKSQLTDKKKVEQDILVNLVELFRLAQIPEELAFHFSMHDDKHLPSTISEKYYIIDCKGDVTIDDEEIDEGDEFGELWEELLFKKENLEEICAKCKRENECETCKIYKKITKIDARMKEFEEKIKELTDYSNLDEEERIGEYLFDFFINKYDSSKEVFPTFYDNPIQILNDDLVLLSYYVEAC